MKKQENRKKAEREIVIAKYTLIGTMIAAIIGLIGTAVTAYFGYLSNRPSQQLSTLPSIPLTNTPTNTPVSTASNMPTFTPASTETPSFTLTPIQQGSLNMFQVDPITGYRIIYPSCKCRYIIDSDETILIRLRWGAQNAELAEKGASLVSYSLTIDKDVVLDLETYRKSATLEANPILAGDRPNAWWVYWDYPIKLDYHSNHIIHATLRTLSAVDNGWNVIPASFIEGFQTTVESYELLPH